MSALSRFGPVVARSMLVQQHRQMASASVASDPIQKLFVDRIREIKTSNKGLDAAHQKQLNDEMLRLKRVYSIDDEAKLANLDKHKFSNECDVSLRDLDTSKEFREQIASGEYQKQLSVEGKKPTAYLLTVPDPAHDEFHLPPMNKPDTQYLFDTANSYEVPELGGIKPDYEVTGDKMTLAKLERELNVHFGEQMPTIHDDDAPQRDKVNFPRATQLLDSPPTRYHIIPESWFQFFYPKTGVTGPYAFAGAFFTFLMSKEWLVMEHELLTGFSSICIFAYAIPKFGPAVRKFTRGLIETQYDGWASWQQGHIKLLGSIADHYKTQFNSGDALDDLYKLRKHDVEMQLESEYRSRVKTIYDDTKRRLNYLVAVADSQRQIQQANLVNMVISNVMTSFGPKQEAEVLDSCIANLKGLAAKHTNVI